MARSNTNYYNLCHGAIGEDGYCEYHRPGRWWDGRRTKCVGAASFETRRGTVRRKARFPEWSWKRWGHGPGREWKRLWERRLRALSKREVARYGEVLTDADKLLAGWYGWWL